MPPPTGLLALVSTSSPPHAFVTPHATCDVELRAERRDSGRWYVHRDILAVRAPGLVSQLIPGMPFVVASSAQALATVVTFAYTDTAPLAFCRRTDLLAMAALGNEYGMPRLAIAARSRLGVRDPEPAPAPVEPPPDLGAQLLTLHTSPACANTRVTQPSTGREWFASATVLAAHSQLYRQLFSGVWEVPRGPDGRWEVTIPPELEPSAVADILRYAHEGSLRFLRSHNDDTVPRAVALLDTEPYFLMPELREAAQLLLSGLVEVGTAVPLWDVAARCDAEDLRDAVRRFCLTHFPAIAADASVLATVPQDLLRALLLDGTMEVHPTWLEGALRRWGTVREGATELDVKSLLPPNTLFCSSNRRAVLRPFAFER